MWSVLHGKRGRVLFVEEALSGSESGMILLGEWLLGMDEADANGMEQYTEFLTAYNWRLLVSAEAADTSRLGREWREIIPGLGTFTGRLEGFADTTDEGQDMLNEVLSGQRSRVIAQLYGATDVGYIKASLMITSRDHETMVNGAQRLGFEFVNVGMPSWEAPSTLANMGANMLAYWKFDDGAGDIAEDSAPYDIDGNLVDSPVWTSGKKNTGLQFVGGSHVSIGEWVDASEFGIIELGRWWLGMDEGWIKKHPLQYRYFLSISLWFKPLGAPDVAHGLIGDTDGTNGWRVTVGADNKVTFVIGDISITSVEEINPLDWNHIVATYNPVKDRMRIYINNIEDMIVGTRSGSVPVNANDIRIGSVGDMHANGAIDQVRIYGVELTKREIDVGGIISMLYSVGE